ncbi:TetR/AcrR family transcriptional regulator [Sphingomonas crocodyli]|nr:TetR family transcriptional regulator [Sphingomonas crocodyli]
MTAAAPAQIAKPRRTQQERRAQSERRIVHAALMMIADRGITRTTLAEVGEAAGYSRGLPAHLFGNKDNLLRECLKRLIVDYWIESLPPPPADRALATLSDAIIRWIDHFDTHPEYARAYYLLLMEASFAETEHRSPELSMLAREVSPGGEARFRAYIEAGRAAGEIRADIDVGFQALAIHETLRGLGLRWLIDPHSVDLKGFGTAFVADMRGRLTAK